MNPSWRLLIRKRALDLGLYGHRRYTPFIVLGRSRVGSNLLRGLLNAHPAVCTFGEVFRDLDSVDWDHKGYFQSERMRALQREQPVAFVRDRIYSHYPTFVRAVGFKLFYYHAREGAHQDVWRALRDRRDVRVIHLKRRNVLQTHLSRKRAAITDRWVNTSGQQDQRVSVHLDYEECLRDFSQTRAWEDEHDAFFAEHPILQVQYEQLVTDSVGEAQRLQAFLGVEPHVVVPSTHRQAHEPLSSTIANYAELKNRFDGTDWADLFTD